MQRIVSANKIIIRTVAAIEVRSVRQKRKNIYPAIKRSPKISTVITNLKK